MKINIEIECETISEIQAHLGMIGTQITQKKDKHSLGNEDELPTMEFHHDNCYGAHVVKVVSDYVRVPYNNISALND